MVNDDGDCDGDDDDDDDDHDDDYAAGGTSRSMAEKLTLASASLQW